EDALGVVIGGNAVDGELAAIGAAVDEHQFTLGERRILFAAEFQRQTDGRHQRATGCQPVSGAMQIHVARPEADRAVVAVQDARDVRVACDQGAAMEAAELSGLRLPGSGETGQAGHTSRLNCR
ncbi:MAG TPA: hypothetical protein VLM83_10460, partial [Anaerolineales bacterium]|nr:hypothetical protein [Anaerolineales bacterium]